MVTRMFILQCVIASITACSPSVAKETTLPSATNTPTESPTPVQTQTPTPIAYTPIEFWGSSVDSGGLQWMEEGAIEAGVRLEAGIYGIDQDNPCYLAV